jgi:hypothetical protein
LNSLATFLVSKITNIIMSMDRFGRPPAGVSIHSGRNQPLVGVTYDTNSNLDFGNKKLTNISNATEDQEAITLKQLQDERMSIVSDCQHSIAAQNALIDPKLGTLEINVNKSQTDFGKHTTQIHDHGVKINKLIDDVKVIKNQTVVEITRDINKLYTTVEKSKKDIQDLQLHKDALEVKITNNTTENYNRIVAVNDTLEAINHPRYIGYYKGQIINNDNSEPITDSIQMDNEEGVPEDYQLHKFNMLFEKNKSNLDNFSNAITFDEEGFFRFNKHCLVNLKLCVTEFNPIEHIQMMSYDMVLADDMGHSVSLYRNEYNRGKTNMEVGAIRTVTHNFMPGDMLMIKSYIVYNTKGNVDCNIAFWFQMDVDSYTPY